jgi:hypothetical protein
MRPSDEGYALFDHRASPGLSVGLRREGSVVERKTLTCCHCRTAMLMNPERERARHYCHSCHGRFLCDWCHEATKQPGYTHLSFEQRVDLLKDAEAKNIAPAPRLLLPY